MGFFTRTGLDARAAAALVEREEAIVLDVRDDRVDGAGHVAGAVRIPLADSRPAREELPKGRTIVAVCRTGGRSR